jgi:hypothetical protein
MASAGKGFRVKVCVAGVKPNRRLTAPPAVPRPGEARAGAPPQGERIHRTLWNPHTRSIDGLPLAGACRMPLTRATAWHTPHRKTP